MEDEMRSAYEQEKLWGNLLGWAVIAIVLIGLLVGFGLI